MIYVTLGCRLLLTKLSFCSYWAARPMPLLCVVGFAERRLADNYLSPLLMVLSAFPSSVSMFTLGLR